MILTRAAAEAAAQAAAAAASAAAASVSSSFQFHCKFIFKTTIIFRGACVAQTLASALIQHWVYEINVT